MTPGYVGDGSVARVAARTVAGMTEWGIDTLFNPGKRHMDEEKRRLQSTREEVGDSSGGRRIDLDSGKVRIGRPGGPPSADPPSADPPGVAPSADATPADPPSANAEAPDAPAGDDAGSAVARGGV
jgi:hypothetical protein